jgi:hypothetical protein
VTVAAQPVVELRARLPEGWVRLPVESEVDADAWAVDAVAGRTDLEEPSEITVGPEAAAAMLAAFVRRAQATSVPGMSAHLALAYQPDPHGRVLVFATATVFPFEGQRLTRRGLLRDLGASPATVGDRDVSKVTLPLGKAVRLRRMFDTSAADLLPDGSPAPADPTPGEADVMEGITHVALPRGLEGFVHVNAVWNDLVWGDQLAAMVDVLATGLTIRLGEEAAT